MNHGISFGFAWQKRSTRVNRHCHTDHGQSVDEGGVTSPPLLQRIYSHRSLFRQCRDINWIDSIGRKICNRMINVWAVLIRRRWMFWSVVSTLHPFLNVSIVRRYALLRIRRLNPSHFSGGLTRRPGENRNSILYFNVRENNAATSHLYPSKNWCYTCVRMRIHACTTYLWILCTQKHTHTDMSVNCLSGLFSVKCIPLIYRNIWSADLK